MQNDDKFIKWGQFDYIPNGLQIANFVTMAVLFFKMAFLDIKS